MTFWYDIEHSCIICHHTHWHPISIFVTQSICMKITLYEVAVSNITLFSIFVRNQTKLWALGTYICVECAFKSLNYNKCISQYNILNLLISLVQLRVNQLFEMLLRSAGHSRPFNIDSLLPAYNMFAWFVSKQHMQINLTHLLAQLLAGKLLNLYTWVIDKYEVFVDGL